MPCDKFMELPLEERLRIQRPSQSLVIPEEEVAYYVKVNPETQRVEYKIPPSNVWVYES